MIYWWISKARVLERRLEKDSTRERAYLVSFHGCIIVVVVKAWQANDSIKEEITAKIGQASRRVPVEI